MSTMSSIVGTIAKNFEIQLANPVTCAGKGEESFDVLDHTLSFNEGRYTLMIFYPLDWTFVCPTELIAFSDNIKQFRDLGCDVYGVSVDSAYCHRAWMLANRSVGGLGPNFKIPLVSDLSHELGKHFQCMVGDKGFHYRASILIDGAGKIRASVVYDTNVGRSVDETLRMIKAFKYSEEHGEVCPVNFTPETRKVGLIPDPAKAMDYFKKTA